MERFSIDDLKEMVADVNSWNGQLEDYNYYENDEYFFRDFFGDKVNEAVRATYYGDYNYMDDYVRFNAYGNLDSVSELQYEKELEENAEEIIETYIEEINNMYEGELKNKVLEYMEENKEEL